MILCLSVQRREDVDFSLRKEAQALSGSGAIHKTFIHKMQREGQMCKLFSSALEALFEV